MFADFDAIRNMEGRQFVEDVLIGRFGAGMVLCGFNFRFGKNAAWDAMRLRAYLEDRGIWVRILEHQDYQGAPISSTRIRAAVQAGEMEQAAAMLGYNFTFENPVLHGDARGRTIGYPTINQQYPDGLVLPKFGVYESRILVEDTWYRGFTNIGVRPTWQVETPLAETHIFDYNGDLYGQTVQVELVRYLRPEQKFSSIGALREQLDHDKSSIL